MHTFISRGSSIAAISILGHLPSVSLSANRVVPQPVGTTITWTATPSGGMEPYEYKWFIHNGSRWEVAANWSRSNTFTWKPAFANPRYRVAVWLRSGGTVSDRFCAATESAFAIFATDGDGPSAVANRFLPAEFPGSIAPVSTVTLRADPVSPQRPGTTITWTVSATGGGSRRQFKWFVYDGTAWRVAAPWSSADTFLWTPIVPSRRYQVAVWARSEDSTRDDFEASAEAGFIIEDGE